MYISSNLYFLLYSQYLAAGLSPFTVNMMFREVGRKKLQGSSNQELGVLLGVIH